MEKNKSDTNRQSEITEENQMYYEKKLQDFECPFTWKMNEVKNPKAEYHPHDDEEFIPLMKLMRSIVRVYEDVKNKEDHKTIINQLGDCDKVIDDIKDWAHPDISIEAILFVLRSMKCFVFLHFKMEPELKQLLHKTAGLSSSEKKQISTIKACKSIAWSNYRLYGTTEAIQFIREAIADNPNCDLWHFILGKLLRRKRRNEQFYSIPDTEEMKSFEKAYDMMKNPVYGVYLAQAYREKQKFHASAMMNEKILKSGLQSDTLLLRLSLGFMNIKDFQNAKFCLDKVAEKSGKASMYLHYRGLYYFKQKQYREASLFLKEAIKDNNLAAEHNYMFTMQKIDRSFDVTKHLLGMLDKYTDWPKEKLQPFLLQIGFTYYKKDRNFVESLKYFLEAIEINPDAKCHKYFFSDYICNNKERNIYKILSQDILPIVLRQPNKFDHKTYQKATKLKEYCDKQINAEIEQIHHRFSRVRL